MKIPQSLLGGAVWEEGCLGIPYLGWCLCDATLDKQQIRDGWMECMKTFALLFQSMEAEILFLMAQVPVARRNYKPCNLDSLHRYSVTAGGAAQHPRLS